MEDQTKDENSQQTQKSTTEVTDTSKESQERLDKGRKMYDLLKRINGMQVKWGDRVVQANIYYLSQMMTNYLEKDIQRYLILAEDQDSKAVQATIDTTEPGQRLKQCKEVNMAIKNAFDMAPISFLETSMETRKHIGLSGAPDNDKVERINFASAMHNAEGGQPDLGLLSLTRSRETGEVFVAGLMISEKGDLKYVYSGYTGEHKLPIDSTKMKNLAIIDMGEGDKNFISRQLETITAGFETNFDDKGVIPLKKDVFGKDVSIVR